MRVKDDAGGLWIGGLAGTWRPLQQGIQEREQRGWKDQLYPVEFDTFLKSHVCPIGSWMFQSGV